VEQHNRNIAKARVSIERLFGLTKEIFPRMQNYTGGDNLETDIDNVLLLLNIYMVGHPLTPENGAMNARFISANLRDSDLAKEKKKQSQKRYREKVKERKSELDTFASYIEEESPSFPLDNIQEIVDVEPTATCTEKRKIAANLDNEEEDEDTDEKISGESTSFKRFRNNDGEDESPQEKKNYHQKKTHQ
jgi:hypothetical protein